MSTERVPDHRPFLYFVLVLAGSAATLLLVTWGQGPLSPWPTSRTIVVGVLAFLLTIPGWSTGIWMLIGRAWRAYPHPRRLDLAFAYLAVGWVGSLVIFQDSPGMAPCAAAGLPILVAYLLLRFAPALRRPTTDEDLFP